MSTQLIRVDRLHVSPRNVRKTGGKQVTDLATSILAHGLLHNLTVIADGDRFEVIDGGRRLTALQSLVKSKKLADDLQVPCLVRADSEAAVELSAAANAFTEPMHPADQCEAFKAMIDQGATVADIAARFSVTELVVKQRLKLANVSAKLVDVYRTGKMNLEQLQTLALSDDHGAQEKAYFGVKNDYERSPHYLRERLTKALVSPNDRRVQMVGMRAYEAAGGTVIRDLFSTRDEGYLTDSLLLDQLVAEKMQATVEALEAAGWSWVELKPDFDYNARESYAKVPADRVQLDPSPEQADRLAKNAARDAELQPLYDALDRVTDATDEQLEELERYETELADLDQEREEINEGLLVYSQEVKAISGAVVTLGYHGIEVHEARLRPGERLSKDAREVVAAVSISKPAKSDHSDAVMRSLSAHRSAVARHHVSRSPDLALALMVEWLMVRAVDRHSDAGLLRLAGTSVCDPLHAAPNLAPDLIKQAEVDRDRIAAVMRQADPLAWLLDQPQSVLLELLAIGVASRFDGHVDRGTHAGVERMHKRLGFDMADYWEPTAQQFLGRVSSEVVLKAVADACGKREAAELKNLKKAELVARAEPLLTAKRWLPKPLRTPAEKKPRDAKQRAAGDDDK